MSNRNSIYGLLGEHLGHSFSPFLHHALGDTDYRLYERPESELEAFIKQDCIGGLNITIPYKQTVLSFVDECAPSVQAIGATNTLYRRNGTLIAENTDVLGFIYLLHSAGIKVKGKQVLIFGNGGAAKAVLEGLRREGAGELFVVSRRGGDLPLLSYDDLPAHYDADILVNTTPVGMFPDNLSTVVDLTPFRNLSGVIDIVYNPIRTGILLQAEALGIPCANGLSMLVAQAVRSHEFFFNTKVDDSVITQLCAELTRNATNLVLIGMPGSGKSSVAQRLAERTGREVIDLDAEIEQAAGKSIPAIFSEDGERVFRDLESQCIAKAGAKSGIILSLGGGAVTEERNYLPLHQNGRIYCLKRDLSLLATDGRPLSKDLDTLKAMERTRAPMYERFADVFVENNGALDVAVSAILEDFNR